MMTRSPQDEVPNGLSELLKNSLHNQNSPVTRANLKKLTDGSHEEDFLTEEHDQDNALLTKTILDANGHVNVDTREQLHSKDVLRGTIAPQLEIRNLMR